MGGVYLDTCLGERMFVWFDQNPGFMQGILFLIALMFIVALAVGLLFRLLEHIRQQWAMMKFKEAFTDVTNGVMVTSGFGIFVLAVGALIMAGYAGQANDEDLFYVSIVGMALFGTVWFAVFSTLTVLMNVILIPLLIRDFMRELREKRKNYLSDGSAGTEGLAR